jgi:phosphoribosyl-ATP pyrophosphohydrolase/phosphoribosyl-AMP cyclohydrolase
MTELARRLERVEDLATVNFAKGGGTVPVVAQHVDNGQVIMVAMADREALERTIHTGSMHYRSRSRGLWHKGATSGNVQRVAALLLDCDGDAVLARVRPAGPGCHTGADTCFGNTSAPRHGPLEELDATIADRASSGNVGPSYTQRLLADRNLRLKKLGEEGAELIAACADGDRTRATAEVADLVYHALVALRALGGTLADVERELDRRRAPSSSNAEWNS